MSKLVMYTEAPPGDGQLSATTYLSDVPVLRLELYFDYDYYKVEVHDDEAYLEVQQDTWSELGHGIMFQQDIDAYAKYGQVVWYE